MEVKLRKPQRILFEKMKANAGCYLRSYRKSFSASRTYWRLMTENHSPLGNITPSTVKPFFNLSILIEQEDGTVKLKDDVSLYVKPIKEKR